MKSPLIITKQLTLRSQEAILHIDEQITTAQRNALIAYLGPGPLNLRDYDTRNAKLHGLFCLLLQCPASHLH